MTLVEDLKYDYPKSFRAVVFCLALLSLTAMIVSVPDNSVTRATGLVALKDRFGALRLAVYWESRALVNPTGSVAPVVEYGYLAGVDYDGKVFVSIPVKTEFVQRKVQLADVQITNLNGVAGVVKSKRKIDARIEMYGDMAVIWISGRPLNVDLVEAKLAAPDPNPPTNIVDRIFATYYWNKVKGNKL